MLKVLHVAKFYPPERGGMERVVQMLCRAAPHRLDSAVLAFGRARRTQEDVVDGVGVTRVGTLGMAGSVPIAPGFTRALRAARADVLVLHEPNPWALLAFGLSRPRIPLAIWFHSEVVRPSLQYSLFYAPLAHPAYGAAARIIVSSPDLGRHAKALQSSLDRVRVIPFGIDASRWMPGDGVRARAEEIRRQHGLPLVVFAGRLVSYKGVDVLLRAASSLPVSVVVIGDGPMRAEWSALARQLNGCARVAFAGEVDDAELHAHLAACDMFVLPSITRAEAFGYVQLEAMACGRPVVSTALPSGVPWVNRHGETGLVVPPGDVGALRAAIGRLAADAGLRARLGAAGRARIARDFTLDGMADAFVRVCEEAASARGAGA
ncbi:MAG TPA: glycosyltransferase [Vicinamibacterales bacterium]|nr:glycosyltransferase [Vicinamibacterales bacterium]